MSENVEIKALSLDFDLSSESPFSGYKRFNYGDDIIVYPYVKDGKDRLLAFFASLPDDKALQLNLLEIELREGYIHDWAGYEGLINCSVLTEDGQVLTTEIAGLEASPVQLDTSVSQVYPNPFNSTIQFDYSVSSLSPEVKLSIYDVSGKLVRKLKNEKIEAPGSHSVIWDGRNDSGGIVSSGVYFWRLESSGIVENGRFALVK